MTINIDCTNKNKCLLTYNLGMEFFLNFVGADAFNCAVFK